MQSVQRGHDVLAEVACHASRCILDHRSRERFTDGHRAREWYVAVTRHHSPPVKRRRHLRRRVREALAMSIAATSRRVKPRWPRSQIGPTLAAHLHPLSSKRKDRTLAA